MLYQLATGWDAVVLIDEADVFLEQRSLHDLDASARLTIWIKFFELAGWPFLGSEEFVNVDGQEPRCYVALSNLEVLAQKPFNGRTIKNLVRTAQSQALALSTKEPLSLDHVKVVIRAQEKFWTAFAQIRS
ncbi:uncharacterized protein EDB93DRAFT_1239394 [Suillus bovinus]|uniref:uncharacterized protein n=1 Tax=Suillus bovinus TaxID=48563 RepID=UPI001B86F5F5|nr:uncharacterized protein EDB93DRAFT_1239394 [Suillus bovinus]KAG2155131.1 hypothetical protein EDB93DRAFT_1239394 [Suillus bovinus]